MEPPSGALSTSSQTSYVKVRASKELDSLCQQLPVSFFPTLVQPLDNNPLSIIDFPGRQ